MHLGEDEADGLVKHRPWLCLQLLNVRDGKFFERVTLVGDACKDVFVQITKVASLPVLNNKGELDETLWCNKAISDIHDSVENDSSTLKRCNAELNDLIVMVVLQQHLLHVLLESGAVPLIRTLVL